MSQPSSQPDHRDLYLLVIGLAVGLLLSEWCLGRFSYSHYEQWFKGGHKARLERNTEQSKQTLKIKTRINELAQKRIRIEALKSESALEDFERSAEKELKEMAALARRRLDHFENEMKNGVEAHQKYHQRLLTGLIMVIVVMMILETLMEPSAGNRNLQRRFSSVRYAVMAGWLALFLAQPEAFSRAKIPVAFFFLLLVVALGAALAPLGRDRSRPESDHDSATPPNTPASAPAATTEQSESPKPPDTSDSPASDQPDQKASS